MFNETVAGVSGLSEEVVLQVREIEKFILRPMTTDEVQAIGLYLINNPEVSAQRAFCEMSKYL